VESALEQISHFLTLSPGIFFSRKRNEVLRPRAEARRRNLNSMKLFD